MADSISLPITDENLSLTEALQNMKEAGRSGLVWRKQSTEFSLITAADVLRGRKARAKRLEDLPGKRIHVYTASELETVKLTEKKWHPARSVQPYAVPDLVGGHKHKAERIRVSSVEVIGKTAPGEHYVDIEPLLTHLSSKGTDYGIFASSEPTGDHNLLLFTSDPEYRSMLEPGPADCYCPIPKCPRGGSRGEKCPKHRLPFDCGKENQG